MTEQINTSSAIVQATVPLWVKDQLEEARWQARTSLSAHIAGILEAHCRGAPLDQLPPDVIEKLDGFTAASRRSPTQILADLVRRAVLKPAPQRQPPKLEAPDDKPINFGHGR
jgi:hypothetical protein